MNRPRWRKVLADLTGNKTRTVLAVLSIAIGALSAGFIIGLYLFLSHELNAAYLAINPHDGQVISDPVDQDMIDAIAAMSEVGEAEGRASLGLKVKVNGEWKDLTLEARPDFNNIQVDQITPELGNWPPKNEVVFLERSSMAVMGVNVGDKITLQLSGGKERQILVAGTVHDLNAAPASIVPFFQGYITLSTLVWLGQPAQFDTIYFTASENRMDKSHLETVTGLVSKRIESSGRSVYLAYTSDPGESPINSVVSSLLGLMGAMGIFIIFLSGFLVINTINALLAQHIRQIGIMKAVGAQRVQIFAMYLAVLLGFGALAFALAAPLSTFLTTISAQGMGSLLNYDFPDFTMPPAALVLEAILSFLVPVLAGCYPVWSGTRVTVREAISDYGLGRGQLKASLLDRFLEQLRFLSRPMLISLRNTFRRKARVALTLIVLTLAGSLFISVFTNRTSLVLTAENVLRSFLSDVNMTTPGRPLKLSEQIARRVPGVVDVEGWLDQTGNLLNADKKPVSALAITGLPTDSKVVNPQILTGRWLLPDDQNAIVLGSDLPNKYPEIQVGNTITVRVAGRDKPFVIVGLYRVIGQVEPPQAFIPYDYLARITDQVGEATTLRISVDQPGTAYHEQVKDALVAAFKDEGMEVYAITAAYYVDMNRQQFDIIAIFLLVMAVVLGIVGGLGLMGTMSMNVMERTREIGVIRAIGASNGQVMGLVIVEGIILGMISYIFAVLLGFPLSTLFNDVVGYALLNGKPDFQIAPEGFILWLLIVIGLSALSSFLPAWRAARLTVREVLAYE